MKRKNNTQSGVALLMALVILALLSILGVAFSTNMRLMERTTRDFIYEVQARYLAEAGVEYAIASLKDNARSNFVFNGFNPSGTDKDEITLPTAQATLPTGNSIVIDAIDTARQVNINNTNAKLLECAPAIGTAYAPAIIKYRNGLPMKKYLTKKSICLAASGIDYNTVKDFITIDTYIDGNVQDEKGDITVQGRSAININTLIEVVDYNDTSQNEYIMLRDMLKKVEGVGDKTAHDIIIALKNNANKPIKSWKEFNNIIDTVNTLGFTSAEKRKVKDMFNPNKKKPHGNTSSTKGIPTEFCFHSGGTYEITATGTVQKGTQTVASKKISTIIKIFDLCNQTTKKQFQGDIDKNWDGVIGADDYENGDGILFEPIYARVTWLDNCPLNVDSSYPKKGYNPSLAETINDSVKLGFWEDFDFWDKDGKKIQDRWDYSKAQWYAQLGDFYVKESGLLHGAVRSVWRGKPDLSGVPFVDRGIGTCSYPILALGRINASGVSDEIENRWKWIEFSSRLYLRSYDGQYTSGKESILDRHDPYPVDYRTLASWEPGAYLKRKYDVGAHIFLKRNNETLHAGQRDVFVNHIDPWKWERETTDPQKKGIACGRWNPTWDQVSGEWDWTNCTKEKWYANESLKWGKCHINASIGGHESVRHGAHDKWTKNDDLNKNPIDIKENDSLNINNPEPGGPYSQDNIEDAWANIYYDARAFPKNNYLCVKWLPEKTIKGEDGNEYYVEDDNDPGKLDKYYEAGNYFILFKKTNKKDIISANAQLYNYDKNDNEKIIETKDKNVLGVDCGGNISDALFALYAANYFFIAKDIRLIDKTGFYSNKISTPTAVEWGTVWGTETMPSTAIASSEKIAFQVGIDTTDKKGNVTTSWYPSVNQFLDIDSQLQPESGSIFSTLQDSGVSTVGTSLRYRTNLVTSDVDISETPVLEDVWVTYLPKTKIMYWREN